MIYSFTIRTKENATEFDEQIFEAGMDDSSPFGGGLHFDREADSLPAAIKSALGDIAKVKGLTVASVQIDAENLDSLTCHASA